MAQGFHWQKPDLDEASLREMRHFAKLREYLFQKMGELSYSIGLSSRRLENTEEYTMVYLQTSDAYKVSDTSIEQIVDRKQQLNLH